MDVLNPDAFRFFRGAGYLKIGDVFESELMKSARELLISLRKTATPPIVVDPLSGQITKIYQLWDRDPLFRRIFDSEKLLDHLELLLGPNIVFLKNRHNHVAFNTALPDKARRLHRDVLQWSRGVVSAFIYLEDAHIENGCTWVVPTSQHLPFVGTPNNGGTWMDEHSVYRDIIGQAIPIPMQAGSVLLTVSLCFHAVGPNNTSGTRISISGAYHSVDELSRMDTDLRIVLRGEAIYRGNDSI
jgi:phytanoyl-CoA hydroxylase